MNSEVLVKIAKVFFAKKLHKDPEHALGKAVEYWQKYLSAVNGPDAQKNGTMLYKSTAKGDCIWVNEGWINFTGRPFESHLGNGWTECIDPAFARQIDSFSREGVETNQHNWKVYKARRHDGVYRWVLDINIVPSDNDEVFHGVVIDIDDEIHFLMKKTPVERWNSRVRIFGVITLGFLLALSV